MAGVVIDHKPRFVRPDFFIDLLMYLLNKAGNTFLVSALPCFEYNSRQTVAYSTVDCDSTQSLCGNRKDDWVISVLPNLTLSQVKVTGTLVKVNYWLVRRKDSCQLNRKPSSLFK